MALIFSSPNKTKTEKTEPQKVSYWLEKLFKQEEEREEDERQGRRSEIQATPQPNENYGEQSTEDRGREDAAKHHFRKIGTDQHKLDDMMLRSNRIIISISSVFPWDIFPSTINVEETRVNIIHRQLFASQVHSVDIKNISNVFIDTDLFFATLTIVSSTFEENNIKIMKLRKKEANLARRMIEGLRMFMERDIDTSKYTTEELIDKLKDLSTTKTVF